MATQETWFVTNNYSKSLNLSDIITPYTIKSGETVDLLRVGGNTPENLANSVIIRNYSSQTIRSAVNNGKPYLTVIYKHTHEGLDVLTGGEKSNADSLHTHDKLTTDSDVNNLINKTLDTEDFVKKNGSINQLSDITSIGADIEYAVAKAKESSIHNNLLELNDGDYQHLTNIQLNNLLILLSGSSADSLHTHDHNLLYNYSVSRHIDHTAVSVLAGTGLSGGGTIDANITLTVDATTIDHNLLYNLDGGTTSEYYHLTSSQHNTLTDGSNADGLHIHSGTHNSLTGLQGGITNEYYHLTFDRSTFLDRLDEDSSGLTFDGISVMDPFWTRDGTILSPLNSGDTLVIKAEITAGELTLDFASQDYKFTQRVNAIVVQGLTGGARVDLELYSADGDNTDIVANNLFSRGSPTDLSSGYEATQLQKTETYGSVRTLAGGTTGVLRPMYMSAGTTYPLQIVAGVANNVGIGKSPTLSGVMEIAYNIYVDTSKVLSFDGASLQISHNGTNGKIIITDGILQIGAEATNYTSFSPAGNLSFVGSAGFYPRLVRQDAQPANGTSSTQIDDGEQIIWIDTNDSNRVYLMYNDNTNTQIVKVELI